MLIKRSFSLAGHRTSVALEQPFWSALEEAAGQQNLSALVARVDAGRDPAQSLASALRVAALEEARQKPVLEKRHDPATK